MHKATFLEGTLRFTITPDGPILVKAGESSGVDPTLPDMRFVRSQSSIYIPGPSIKGVVRAQAERICRSLDGGDIQQKKLAVRQELDKKDWASIQEREKEQALKANRGEPSVEEPVKKQLVPDQCIPLADNPLGTGTSYSGLEDMNYSSGRAIEDMKLPSGPERTSIVYRRSSLVSQVFGHTSLAGRVRFDDAKAIGELQIEERNGVAIDRIYGSVAFGPFNYEVVVGGSFSSRIDFKNLTLAQLALLGLALRDLDEGRVGMGFGKSRGLGRVKLHFDQLVLRYPTCTLATNKEYLTSLNGTSVCSIRTLAGLGVLCSDPAYSGYAFPAEDTADLPDGLSYTEDDFLGVNLLASGNEQVRSIWKACMPAWRSEIGL